MHTLQDEVRSLVACEGVIARAQHPGLAGSIDRLVRSGELAAVVPGVYAAVGQVRDRRIRLLALASRQPDAVLVEHTAAQQTFWPGLTGDEIAYALRRKCVAPPGYRVRRWSVPTELVEDHGPVRVTVPALTALDLCLTVGGDGIDQALRTRSATLAGMRRALELTGGRTGNADRRALLLDSRDEPWSGAERVFHRLLRDAGITGWKANHPVTIENRNYFLDVAFPDLRLVVEIDGRIHLRDPVVFENDRWRQNALVLDGWVVLRFTWRMLEDHPEVVLATILRAVALQSR